MKTSILESHKTEIEAKVEEFRQQLITEYQAKDKDDIDKLNHYIELLMLLIEDSVNEMDDETNIPVNEDTETDANCTVAVNSDYSSNFTNN